MIRFREDPEDYSECMFRLYERKVSDRRAPIGEMTDLRERLATTPLSDNTGSEESLALASEWLRHCMIHHGVCSAGHDAGFRPSRLLFVGNGDNDDGVCVHTTQDMPQRVRYLTLSHCWGERHGVRLLRCNENDFRREVPPTSLPPTFRDAIRITRRLGFKYFWIDSLCILQDDDADWQREASVMGRIYRQATCNIAAADSPESLAGCFRARNPRQLQPESLWHDGAEHFLLADSNHRVFNHKPVLYTRAWVLQEAFLARRTLDCGQTQLFWRCGESRASEVFPGGIPTGITDDGHPAADLRAISADNDQIFMNANGILKHLDAAVAGDRIPSAPGHGSLTRYTNDPFALWGAIVKHYSSMHLTRDTDRRTAFSGIIDLFRPYFGDDWFGLWHRFLPATLLWATAGKVSHPSTERAPSWSWLAIEGTVSFILCDFRSHRDRLMTRFVRAEDPVNGTMRLHFTTPLMHIDWVAIESSDCDGVITGVRGDKSDVSINTPWWMSLLPTHLGDIDFDFDDEIPPDDLFCLCIHVRRSHGGSKTLGLVLGEVQDGVFRRLGYFSDNCAALEPFLNRAPEREIVLI